MKKKVFLVTAVVLMLLMSFTACSKENGQKKEDGASASTPIEVLEQVFAQYSEDEKPIVVGGDAGHSVEGAPGEYDIADIEGINSMFHITEEAVSMTDGAASAVHAMNVNTFTSSVFHLKDASKGEDFAESVKESVLGTRWMCGFPEKLVIISVEGEYMISAFGNGDMIDNFKDKVTTVYGEDASVVVEEIIE